MDKSQKESQQAKNAPVAKAEDVEYSRELADGEDRQAQQRAKKADERTQ